MAYTPPPVRDDLRPSNGECLLHLAPGSHCAKPAGHDLLGDPYHQDDMSAQHQHCGQDGSP